MFHSRHPNYKNALRALFLYRVDKCMVENCHTFSRPVVLKGWSLDLFPSPGNMLEMMGLQPGSRNSGRSPATCILISPFRHCCCCLAFETTAPSCLTFSNLQTGQTFKHTEWLPLCVETFIICHPLLSQRSKKVLMKKLISKK